VHLAECRAGCPGVCTENLSSGVVVRAMPMPSSSSATIACCAAGSVGSSATSAAKISDGPSSRRSSKCRSRALRRSDRNSSASVDGSSIPSTPPSPERVLNMHFYMPPLQNAVELMSCGMTRPELIEALIDILPRFGLEPYHVQRESVGFIFNRIWAAIKRESLAVVADGVATPNDVDRIF